MSSSYEIHRNAGELLGRLSVALSNGDLSMEYIWRQRSFAFVWRVEYGSRKKFVGRILLNESEMLVKEGVIEPIAQSLKSRFRSDLERAYEEERKKSENG